MRRRASTGSALLSEKSISVTRSPAGSKPGWRWLASRDPRKNRPALKSSMSESAICAMTRMWRGAKKRPRRPVQAGSPTCCFKSFTRSARVAFNAGPRLKSNVAQRQRKKVTASTVASGCRFRTNEKFNEPSRPAKERRRRSLHQMLRARPPKPPARASKRPSLSNCRTMRQRDAPSARRSAISFARAVPRASSMFARLRLAMSRTAPAMARSNVPTNVIGPSSSGVVLMLKREGVWICNSRVPSASGGCSAVRRCARRGSRVFARSIVRPERSRARRLKV